VVPLRKLWFCENYYGPLAYRASQRGTSEPPSLVVGYCPPKHPGT
jgi:hypothetical protein